MATKLSPNYRPKESEPFMNPRQKEYFRLKLMKWKEDILQESRETLKNLQNETSQHPDLADRASDETERSIELRTRDRQRKLISKIDAALKRLEDGAFGDCVTCGHPISPERLALDPATPFCISHAK